MSWSHGNFYWNELTMRDVARAKKFYADAMGWSFEAMPMGQDMTYWVAKMGGEPVGGIFDISSSDYEGIPEGWMPYLAVDDVDARAAKAVNAGAKIMKPAFDVPDVGRIVILMEPGGAGIGWVTPAAS